MVTNRHVTIKHKNATRLIKTKRGCPQGGVLSPFLTFLWNLVIDDLLQYTAKHIPGYIQAFADDIMSIAEGDDYLKGEAAKGAVRLMGQGDWTLETAPFGKGIIKAHSTLSNNFLHTLNINKHDSWDITKHKLVLDRSYTITYPTASLTNSQRTTKTDSTLTS